MIYLVFLSILLYGLYVYYYRVWRIRKYLHRFPSPSVTHYSLQNLQKYVATYGPLVHLKMGFLKDILLVSDYNFLQFLLGSNMLINKTPQFRLIKAWLGNNLAIAGGSLWKTHRKLLTPAFHFKTLERFIEIFESGGDSLVQELAIHSENFNLDIHPFMVKCTLDTICESSMGISKKAQDAKTFRYFDYVEKMCRIYTARWTSNFKGIDFLFWFTKDYQKQKKLCKFLHEYTDDVITIKSEELKARKTEQDKKQKKVFIDLVLEAAGNGKILTFKEMRAEVDTFMFAGHETTAAALGFTIYSIANNPHVQSRVFEEQQYLFGNDKQPNITHIDLQNMKYLDKVIKESLRLYPSVPMFGRLIDQDVEYNGITIPKGTIVTLFVPGIHRNSSFFPDPDKFDPDRFDNIDGTLPFAYIPFSAGPRNCIAQKYAILQLKSIVSKIVRHFELFPASPCHELQLTADLVLKSLNGVRIGLRLRS